MLPDIIFRKTSIDTNQIVYWENFTQKMNSTFTSKKSKSYDRKPIARAFQSL